jgi:deoxyadenosine/deoxycytidine kinase
MLICVEGLIGVGKTTLCNALEGIKFFEPVDSNPFLNLYYKDPVRWSFAMQVNLLAVRFEMFQKAQWLSDNSTDCIIDRSYFGDYAFAVVQKKNGSMTDDEFNAYIKMHRVHQRYLLFPDLIIRLRLPIEEEIERIKSRNRECEKDVPVEYLKLLSEAYDDLFEELKTECTVVEIDARKSEEEVVAEAKKIIAELRENQKFSSERYPNYKRI